MSDIDNLQIKIKGDSAGANKEIDKVIANLRNLSTALGGFKSVPGVQTVTKAFEDMKRATSGIDTGKIKEISKSIRSLSSSLLSLDKTARSLNMSAAENQMKVLDNIIKNESTKLMQEWGISAKESAGVVESSIKQIVTSYKGMSERGNSIFGKDAFEDAVRNISPFITYMDKAGSSYQGLLDHIAKTNSNSKVFLPFSPSDFSDFDVMRATLGKAFSTSATGATDLTAYVRDLNSTLGHTVDVGTNDQETFENLYRVVSQARSEVDRTNASFRAMATDSGMLQSAVSNVVKSVSQMNASMNNGFGVQNKVATAEMQGSNFDGLARQISSLSGIDMSALGDTSKLADLARNISQLGHKGVSQATANLPQLTEGLKTFVTEMNKVEGVSFNTEGLANLANAISRLGSKTSTVAVDNIPKLKDAINSLLTDLSKAPAISDNTVRSLEAMAQLANKAGNSFNGAKSGISNFTNNTVVNFDKVKSAANKVISAFGKVAVAAGRVTGINRIVGGIQRLVPATNQAEKGFKGLAKKMTALYAGSFLATRAFSKLKSGIESAMSYVEAYDYYRNTFNELGKNADLSQWKKLGYKSAEEYARSFRERANEVVSEMTGFDIDKYGGLKETGEANLGLNPTQMMETEAMFGQMANSMGVATETASKLSEIYTKLGADMASAFNMDFAQVYDNLQSGMTGMARAVDKYGVNLRVANLQQQLSELGIKANISKISQQDKVLLRTIVTLNATTQAWGNLAQTITSPENQIRLLTQNFTTLAQMLGSLFLPVISKVLPYINGMVIALKSLVSYIGSLLGVDLSDYMKSVSSLGDNENLSAAYDDADNLADSLDNVGDSADKAAKKQKKFNKQLQAFDELNNLTTSEKDKNANKKKSTDVPNITPDLTAALDSAMDKYLKKWDEAFRGMENKASRIADNIKDAFVYAWNAESGYQIGKSLAQFVNKGINWYNKHLPTFKSTAKKIAGILASAVNGAIWNTDWKGLGKAISGSLTAYLDANTKFYDDVEWEQLGRGLADALNEFIEGGVFESYFSNIGSKIRAVIEGVFGFTEDFNFKGLGEHIGNGINNLLGKMDKRIGKLDGWQKLGKSVSNAVKGALDAGIAFLKTTKWDAFGRGVSRFIKSVDFKGVAIKLTNFTVAIFNALTKFLKKVEWFEVGQKIGDFIGNINWKKVLWNFAELAVEVIKAIGAAFVGSLSKAPIETAIVGLFTAIKWVSSTKLGKGVFAELAKKANGSIAEAIAGQGTATLEEAIAGRIVSALPKIIAAAPYAAAAAALGVAIYEGVKIGAEGKIANWTPPVPDFSMTKKAFKDLGQSVKDMQTDVKNAQSLLSNWNPTIKNVEDDAENLQILADKYYELATKTNKTKTETEEMKIMAEKLSQKMPGFKKLIDQQTGAYKGTKEQLQKLVSKTQDYYRIKAAEAQKTKLYEQQVELELKLAKAEREWEKARKAQQDLESTWMDEQNRLLKKGVLEYDDITGELIAIDDKLKGENKELYESYRSHWKAWDENKDTVADYADKVNEARSALNGVNEQIKDVDMYEKKATASMNANSKATVKQTKSFKGLAKNAKSLKKQIKGGATFEVTAKTSKKYKTLIKEYKGTTDKMVELLAEAEESKDYSKVVKQFDGWSKNAKKTLTAYMEGKLDEQSAKKVFKVWDELSENDIKNLKANLSGKQLESFNSLYSSYKSLKDTTKYVTVKGKGKEAFDKYVSGLKAKVDKKVAELTVKVKEDKTSLKSVNEKIKNLEKEKEIKLKTGDIKGANKVQKQIDKWKKVKTNLQTTINLAKIKISWGKLTNTKNWDKLPSDAQKGILKSMGILATGGIFKGGKWQPVTRYAGGGLPTQGQYFMAREAGPELVGTIGNHTAVMNNDQIVASVSDGVFNALNPVLTRVASALARLETGGATASVEGLSNGDIVRIVKNEDTAYRRRTGKGMFA